jgi:hypothetical protein
MGMSGPCPKDDPDLLNDPARQGRMQGSQTWPIQQGEFPWPQSQDHCVHDLASHVIEQIILTGKDCSALTQGLVHPRPHLLAQLGQHLQAETVTQKA